MNCRPMNSLNPDRAEEEFAAGDDGTVPARGYQMLPTVGLGGSAGSIPALRDFFSRMPADTGMAFVVIVHLSPSHESALADLLQRVTAMPVIGVVGTCTVEPNHVYVIPPGRALAAMGCELRLTEVLLTRGRLVVVDLFFRTLADTYGPHATAVVLSGADGDGAIGIRRVKERGGLTIAQDPLEAEHPSMPRSSIATGSVDWVLPVAEMADRIVEFRRMEARVQLLPEEGPATDAAGGAAAAEGALHAIVNLLRARSGHDFSRFDRATLIRRIGRRMQVGSIADLEAYLARLRSTGEEAAALERDLLASVSNFFRDDDCFAALEAWLPTLFLDKGPDDTVRVWVAACATGEEAYSIAMLLDEHARGLPEPPRFQVFATDVAEDAIAAAREGVYPSTIAADVSEERLQRYFISEPGGHKVRRELRECVLFAVQDLLSDAPFAHLDLVSCRNALISFGDAARRQALEIFHFALAPGGKLLLGAAERADEDGALFTALDARHRLYVRREADMAAVPSAARFSPASMRAFASIGVPPLAPGRAGAVAASAEPAAAPTRSQPAATRSDVHFQLIERFGPPSVVVDAAYDVLHLSHRAGRFLRIGGGEPSRNLLHMIDPMLRTELHAALLENAETGAPAQIVAAALLIEGRPVRVDIVVTRADEIAADCQLVVFTEQAGPGQQPVAVDGAATADRRATELDRELDRLKAHLRRNVEEHEASVEELRASNEELQAMNEELRAATEELETSREELQSINEEMSTVNREMRAKVDDIVQVNSHLRNLMSSISTATVFLDADLLVTLYTPSAVGLFNFIASDIGRPLADLAQRLVYPQLQEDARQVLASLLPLTREVGDGKGRWYRAGLQPYRTVADRIAGVVITFADISERHAEDASRSRSRAGMEAQLRHLDGMLAALPDTVFAFDAQLRFVYAGQGVEPLFGTASRQIGGLTLREAGCPPEIAERIEGWARQVLETGQAIGGADGEAGRIGSEGRFDFIFAPLRKTDGSVDGVVGWSRGTGPYQTLSL